MTKDVYKINVDQSLKQAERMFDKYRIRHLPVVKDDNLVGILSLTDVLRLSFGNTFGTADFEVDEAIVDMLSIEQVMKHKPRVVQSSDPIKDVAEILTNEEFHALPVVEGVKLVGMVTTTDIIKFLLNKVYVEHH